MGDGRQGNEVSRWEGEEVRGRWEMGGRGRKIGKGGRWESEGRGRGRWEMGESEGRRDVGGK